MIETADRHIREGEHHIAVGKRLIGELSSLGSDISMFASILSRFQETQRLHVAHRDRLRRELNAPRS
jgi:hypothetical protein